MKYLYCVQHRVAYEGYGPCYQCRVEHPEFGNYVELTGGEYVLVTLLLEILRSN